MLPFTSAVSGAAKVLKQTAGMAASAYPVIDVWRHRDGVAEGAGQAAVDGLQTLLQRAVANNATKAAITAAASLPTLRCRRPMSALCWRPLLQQRQRLLKPLG